jgi:hypothetical protein
MRTPSGLRNLNLFAGALFGLLSVAARAEDMRTYNVFLGKGSAEVRLGMDYTLSCPGSETATPIHGTIPVPGYEFRFDLFPGNHHVDVLLGRPGVETAEVRLDEGSNCTVNDLRFSVTSAGEGPSISELVRRYSPFYVVRKNQIGNRETDVPLSQTYNVFEPGNGRRIIQYSLYYTDEDSKKSAKSEESQMARYGRRTDIQWSYRVEVNPAGEKVDEWFQGGILHTGIGHAIFRFRGEFMPNSEHPVLFDISNHNAYSDCVLHRPASLVGYSFADNSEVPFPVAREDEMFKNPWMFLASDAELARQGKLAHPSSEYLYVQVTGSIHHTPLVAHLDFSTGESALSGGGQGSLDRLGEDTWNRVAYTALPLGDDGIRALLNGTSAHLSFTSGFTWKFNAHIESLRFFILRPKGDSLETVEISDQFRCDYADASLPSCDANASQR